MNDLTVAEDDLTVAIVGNDRFVANGPVRSHDQPRPVELVEWVDGRAVSRCKLPRVQSAQASSPKAGLFLGYPTPPPFQFPANALVDVYSDQGCLLAASEVALFGFSTPTLLISEN